MSIEIRPENISTPESPDDQAGSPELYDTASVDLRRRAYSLLAAHSALDERLLAGWMSFQVTSPEAGSVATADGEKDVLLYAGHSVHQAMLGWVAFPSVRIVSNELITGLVTGQLAYLTQDFSLGTTGKAQFNVGMSIVDEDGDVAVTERGTLFTIEDDEAELVAGNMSGVAAIDRLRGPDGEILYPFGAGHRQSDWFDALAVGHTMLNEIWNLEPRAKMALGK